jgi:pyridoxamine 5'-phosphate oxidase-like protein
MNSPCASSPTTMTDREPTETTYLDRYGSSPLPWSRAHDPLAAGGHMSFLGTTRPDGRPHAAGVGVVWLDGDVYFTSGPGTRKARNLQASPACTMSVRVEGLDVVLEGEAHRVTDPATLESIASLYREGGWPAEVDGDALTAPYSAPSAGPPPWHVCRFAFHTAFGVATAEPFGATRWGFERR